MTPRDVRNIHNTRKRDTIHAQHGTKTTPVFLPADEKAS